MSCKSVQKTLLTKNEANFSEEKFKKNASTGSYGEIIKKEFGDEHCIKNVDWLKIEYVRIDRVFDKTEALFHGKTST